MAESEQWSDDAVKEFLHLLALAVVLAAIEPLASGNPLSVPRTIACAVVGAALTASGSGWRRLKSRIAPGFRLTVVSVASDFRWWLALLAVVYVYSAVSAAAGTQSNGHGRYVVAPLALLVTLAWGARAAGRFGIPERLRFSRPAVSFGTPEQASNRPHFSWWFVTITANRVVEDCKIFLVYAYHDNPTFWQFRRWSGEVPAHPEVLTLKPCDSADAPSIAIAIRAEERCPEYDLPSGVARLCTRLFYKVHMVLPESFIEPEAGLHEIRLRVTSPHGDWLSPPYWLRVPEYWEHNGTFTLTTERPTIETMLLPDADAARLRRRHSAQELAKFLPFARRLVAQIAQTPPQDWYGTFPKQRRLDAEALTKAIVPCVQAFSPMKAAEFRLTQLQDGERLIVLEWAGRPPEEQRALGLYASETTSLLESLLGQLEESGVSLQGPVGHRPVEHVDTEALGHLERLAGRVHEARLGVFLEPGDRYDAHAFCSAVDTLQEAFHDNESRIDKLTARSFAAYLDVARHFCFVVRAAQDDDADADDVTKDLRDCEAEREALVARLRDLRTPQAR